MWLISISLSLFFLGLEYEDIESGDDVMNLFFWVWTGFVEFDDGGEDFDVWGIERDEIKGDDDER